MTDDKRDIVEELQRMCDESGITPTLHGHPVNLVDLRDGLKERFAAISGGIPDECHTCKTCDLDQCPLDVLDP